MTTTPSKLAPLTAFEVRQLANAANLDPQAVRRMLKGISVRRSTRVLVEGAARQLGWLDRVPAEVLIPSAESAEPQKPSE